MSNATANADVSTILITIGTFIIMLYIIGMSLNGIGLYLVYKSGHRLQTNQRLYLMNFIVGEILMSTSQVCYVVGHILQNRNIQIYAALVQCSLAVSWCMCMIFLTLDRFLEVRLNISYHVYVTQSRVVASNCFVWILALVNISWMVGLQAKTGIDIIGIVLSLIFPIFEGLFLVVCSTVYVYIFSRVKQKQREARKLTVQRKQLSTYEQKIHDRKKRETRARNFVPLYIILTFLVFSSLPELIVVIFLKGLNWSGVKRTYVMFVATSLFASGYIVDALIYLLMYRSLRVMFRRKILRKSRVSTNSLASEAGSRRMTTEGGRSASVY